MHVVVLTPVRLLGDGLASCFSSTPQFTTVHVVHDLAALRSALEITDTDVALVDVTQTIDLIDVREIAIQWPDTPLVARGLTEERQQVIKCGRAGFSGYVAREATIEGLCVALSDIVAGRVACPPEITGGLLRALFRKGPQTEESLTDPMLTRRESEVLALISRGMSNKEIGKELCLSVATIKHYVHQVLTKLGLSRRAEAMRRVRDAPWMVNISSLSTRM
ncbi:MAG: response regulator transcription factor [Planctomycetota bacterium]